MDNNLPNDPPNSGNGSPPPFGSNFNPHTNPVDPNNPYAAPPQSKPQPQPSPPAPNPPQQHSSQTPPPQHPNLKHHPPVFTEEVRHKLSELAKNRSRDAQGHFIHPTNIPAIIEVNHNTEPSDKKDPPLFGFFITNPITYLKLFLKRLLKRQAITLRIPVLALIIIMVGIGGFGVGFQSGLNWALLRLFPNSSPILHRAITEQGLVLKNKGQYFLKSDNKKSDSLWTLKSVSANVKLEEYVDLPVQIKGNLTPTPNLIEVSEVISFDTEADESLTDTSLPSSNSQTNTTISNVSSNASPDTSVSNSTSGLPALYSGLTWQSPKNKTLTFTSGTRKIEQEVIYIESLQSNTYPQDFISYYTQQLTNSGFKQTLNSSEPNSISITYSKGNLFLTYGVKNITRGSDDSKQNVGYKAYIEHN